MNPSNFDLNALLAMAHSPLHNYIVPGLSSYLIGNPSPAGTMRLFRCSRNHQENIVPHSHRFDFQCWVLRGRVLNRIWTRTDGSQGDDFQESQLVYQGAPGHYETVPHDVTRFRYTDRDYTAGQCYSMTHDQIHSIYFEKDTDVLFFEGPSKTDRTTIIEPWVANAHVPTFAIQPWMFQSCPK